MGARRNNATPVDDDDAVAGALNLRKDMAGEDHGHTSPQAVDQIPNALYLVRIQPDGGLVHNDDFGIPQEGVRDADPLAESF